MNFLKKDILSKINALTSIMDKTSALSLKQSHKIEDFKASEQANKNITILHMQLDKAK